MAKLCSICANIRFLDLPPFPPWLRTYHIPIGGTSDLVPWVPEKYAVEDDGLEDDRPEKSRSLPPVKAEMSLGLPHHKSLDDLSESATVCELCKTIQLMVCTVKSIWDEAEKNPRFQYYNRSGPPKYELYLSTRREEQDGFLVWSMSEKRNEIFLLAGVGYCVNEESSLGSVFRGRPILTDAKAVANFDRYRTWVRDCINHHSECSGDSIRPATPTWPLRLLDLGAHNGSINSIRLVESPPVGIKYATLSHCWGDSLHFTLTHATLSSHKEAIEASALPQTYQDVILVARELGVRYIWIDSLCICQDDGGDWERESAKMASIYNNAYVSIASSSASSDATGFLTARQPPQYLSVPVTMTLDEGQESLTGDLKLFPVPAHLGANGGHYVEMKHEPLPARAWALQERYLAPRTLLFGRDQTFFECAHHFVSEDGYHRRDKMYKLSDKHNNSAVAPKHLPDVRYRRGRKWYEILGTYSGKKMSKESDKLPALSGLARAFEDVMGGGYIAGLWKEDLVEGLAFQCFGGASGRPKQWRAPSWSWASVEGKIAISCIGGWNDLLEVKDVKVQVSSENPYGEVKSGELHLHCTLEKLSVSEEPEPDADKVPHARNRRVCFEGGKAFGHYSSFDIKGSQWPTHDEELYGIPLAGEFKDEKMTAYVLLVVQDGGKGGKSFRREGFCLVSEKAVVQRWKQAKETDNLTDIVLV